MSNYYYRLDGRTGAIQNKHCPKTEKQVNAIKNPKERDRWTKVANRDETMEAYKWAVERGELI